MALAVLPLFPPRHAGVAASLALHALALVVLLQHLPVRQAMVGGLPISVQLLTAPAPQRPAPRAEQPVTRAEPTVPPRRSAVAPVPQAPAAAVAPPVLAAPAQASVPASTSVAPRTQAPAAPKTSSAASSSSAAATSGTSVPTAPAAEAVPVSAPIFNAAYLDNPAPAYPALSRRAGEQGRVLLRVLVGAAGRAEDVQVRGSSGSTRLDEAARDTVRRWRFVPARRGDEAVAAWVLIPISFSLGG